MPVETIVQLITDLGSFGFILYLVHRTQTHTIPRLASSFEQAIDRQRQDFREMIERQRQDFREMLEHERAEHARQTDRIVEAIQKLPDPKMRAI